MKYDLLIMIGVFILFGVGIVGSAYWIQKKRENETIEDFIKLMNYTRKVFNRDEYGNKVVQRIIDFKIRIETNSFGYHLYLGDMYEYKVLIVPGIVEDELYEELHIENSTELKQFKIEVWEDGKQIYNCRLTESHEMYDDLKKVLRETSENQNTRNKEVIKKLLEEL